jgi:hypothetical protein
MYERRGTAPLTPRRFLKRVAAHFCAASALVGVSLGVGMAGYMYFERLAWADAFLNAAMLLGGMGPVESPATFGGKLFAGAYALYSGLVFLVAAGIILAPGVHRLLHQFHWEQVANPRSASGKKHDAAEQGDEADKARSTSEPCSLSPVFDGLRRSAGMTTDAQPDRPSRRAALLGWPLIAFVGGGASLASLAILALLVLILDVFVLAKGPVTTEYWTIVEAKGAWADSSGATGYTYAVRKASGAVTDAHLPWRAKPGDRVRLRQHQSRILHLTLAAAAPILCSPDVPCE